MLPKPVSIVLCLFIEKVSKYVSLILRTSGLFPGTEVKPLDHLRVVCYTYENRYTWTAEGRSRVKGID